MSETITIQAEQSKTTAEYAVYDSPDGDESQQLVGTYVAQDAADSLGEYAEFEVSESDGSLTLTQDKTTASFGVFSDSAEAIEATYISHEVLAEVSGQDADSDSYEAPDEVTVTARPSDEDAFAEALDEQTVSEEETQEVANALVDTSDDSDEEEEQTQEEAADALVAGADGGSETEADEEADVEEISGDDISDEEIGL